MEHVDEKQPPTVLTSDTDNQTTIDPAEAPPAKRTKFERLRAYNTGLWNGPQRENTEEFRRQDDLHLYDSIAGQCGLTPYQKERGRQLLDQFSIGDYTSQTTSAAAVMLALCAVVANSDVEDGTRYWPHPDATSNDRDFERVASDLATDWRTLVGLIMQLDHRLGV